MDQARAGTSIWEYGDGAYGPFVPGEWTPTPLYDAVLRAYPEAVPGTLSAISYDARARTLDVSWTASPGGVALLRAPSARYPEGIEVTGVGGWRWDRVRGIVAVRVAPGDGGVHLAPAG